MSIAKFLQSDFNGEISAIASKSYAHRALICSAFCKDATLVRGVNSSYDMKATISVLTTLGSSIAVSGNEAYVTPIKNAKRGTFECLESGSTLRFMLPIICALGSGGTIKGSSRLAERPIGELCKSLTENGVTISGEKFPLSILGKLTSGNFTITGEVSSQYISGILMAAPLLEQDVTIKVTGEQSSKSYIEMTISIMREFGVTVQQTDEGYFVKGGQQYVSPLLYKVEGDYSNASYFILAGVLGGQVTVGNLKADSLQGDRFFIDAILQMEGKIQRIGDKVIASKSELKAGDFSTNNVPDIVPSLALACAFAEGTSVLRGVERLKQKESDRLSAIMEMLKKIGIESENENDMLIIHGGNIQSSPFVIDSQNDHRIAMMNSILGGLVGNVAVKGFDAVNKSYPNFEADFKKVGGKINVENRI